MAFDELSRDQLINLKQCIMMDRLERVSWGDLMDADELVSDAEVRDVYGGITFETEDFFC